ncbi:MAG: hypothetical protein ACD_69C00298G0001 [uncultured bacterium]|nr:MAG: hypothetical protein ACD_69C00298G0001 [uncultured bacterium]
MMIQGIRQISIRKNEESFLLPQKYAITWQEIAHLWPL